MTKQFKRLYTILEPRERLRFGMQIFLMTVSSFLEVVGVGAIPLFLIFLSSPEKLANYSGTYETIRSLGLLDSTEKLLVIGTVSLGLFFLFKNAFLIYINYLNSKFLLNYKLKLEKKLYRAYLNAPYIFHLSNNTSKFLSSLNSEVRILILNILMPIFKIINFGVLTFAIVVLLLFTEPLISLVIFFILGSTMGIFIFKIRKKIKVLGQEEQRERSVMVTWINQTFGGLKDIRILNRELFFQNRFFESIEKTSRASLFNQVVSNVSKPLVETVSVFAMLGIIYFLMSQGNTMESIVSILVLFGAAFIRLMPSVQALASNYTLLKFSIHAVDPIYEDITLLNNITESHLQTAPLHFETGIVLEHIHFRYPTSTRDVLTDISLKINAGESVAFVGPSGSGKTTLVDVLMGLMSPTAGSIKVDGTDITDNPKGWFRNIGYVPQSIYLIDDTIRRNIALGIEDKEIDEARINAVLEEAQLDEFVNDLPHGLNTSIGERGVRLSGGQRQRIGIARALYHDPQVLVLDEATSALDNVTEKYIIEAIERFKRKRTVIMIAHRLTTVEKCDRLYYMKNGIIINSGTYSELLKNETEFRKVAEA